jgi:RNA polymerase sigma-70 factor (ECF subfamily)
MMRNEELDRVGSVEKHRARLFGIAYRMLGSVQDAEDLVQETYLRWHEADKTAVRSPEAWLVAVVSRLSIDRLRRASTEREAYVGNWLPEPIGQDERLATDRRSEIASDLSMAFLVLLERLSPDERAAFLLRDVFDADYAEIARVLDRGEDAARQIVHRARERVRRDRPRFPVAPDARERLLERFLDALRVGDQEGVLALMSRDVSFTSDGGGKVSAARKALGGRNKIARMLIVMERKYRTHWAHHVAIVNGEPAIVTTSGGKVVSTTSVQTDGERITAFYRMLNPDKLRHVARFDLA